MAVRLAVVALVAFGALGWGVASATPLTHTCLTHDGNPDVVAALAKWSAVAGVRDCGYSSKPDLYVVPLNEFREKWLEAHFAAAVAWQVGGPEGISGCEIWHRPEIEHDEWYWLHEVGHCLGLEHSDVPGAVMNPLQSMFAQPHVPQPDDVVKLQRLYGGRAMLRQAWLGVARE